MSSAAPTQWDFPSVQVSGSEGPVDNTSSNSALTNILRLVGSFDELEDLTQPTHTSPSQDWSKLIDRIREAAKHAREVEAQSQEQELRVQQLLDRAREDLKAAADRVRAADARVAEMQARSEALLKAADERVKAAEKRARVAEEWLARVYETVASEFTVEQDTNEQAAKQIG